jgi:hypothetical protein
MLQSFTTHFRLIPGDICCGTMGHMAQMLGMQAKLVVQPRQQLAQHEGPPSPKRVGEPVNNGCSLV